MARFRTLPLANVELRDADLLLKPGVRPRLHRFRCFSSEATNAPQAVSAGGRSLVRARPAGGHPLGMGVTTSQLRGHFLGHWLSAAAMNAAADRVIARYGQGPRPLSTASPLCQQANGGEWLGSIPEKYLQRIAAGSRFWAPHYTVHKTFHGPPGRPTGMSDPPGRSSSLRTGQSGFIAGPRPSRGRR